MSVFVLPTYSQLDLAIEPPEYSPRVRHGSPAPISLGELGLVPSTSSGMSYDSTEGYVYQSKHMIVNLGPRIWKTTLPAYGRGGTIQGFLDMTDPKGTQSVTITLEGFAYTSVRESGPGGFSVNLPRLKIVSDETTLFKASSSAQSPCAMRIPLTLPITMSRSHPPTYMFNQDGLKVEVAYQLRVDMVRKGWGKHEKLIIPIAYFPKSAPPAFTHHVPPLPESFNWKCRNKYDSLEYKTFKLERESDLIPVLPLDDFSELDVQLHLPQPLDYTVQDPIPFRLTLSTHASSFQIPFSDASAPVSKHLSVDESQLLANLSIELFKVVSVGVPVNRTVRREVLLGKGSVCKVSKGISSDGSTKTQLAKVYGVVIGGKEGGEMSWGIQRGPQSSYEIRVTFRIPVTQRRNKHAPPPPRLDVVFRHSATISLKTNFREELMDLSASTMEAEDPALGLL